MTKPNTKPCFRCGKPVTIGREGMLMQPDGSRSHDCAEGWLEEHGYASPAEPPGGSSAADAGSEDEDLRHITDKREKHAARAKEYADAARESPDAWWLSDRAKQHETRAAFWSRIESRLRSARSGADEITLPPARKRTFVGAVQWALDCLKSRYRQVNGFEDLTRVREWLELIPTPTVASRSRDAEPLSDSDLRRAATLLSHMAAFDSDPILRAEAYALTITIAQSVSSSADALTEETGGRSDV